jgi:hypothetical protein
VPLPAKLAQHRGEPQEITEVVVTAEYEEVRGAGRRRFAV